MNLLAFIVIGLKGLDQISLSYLKKEVGQRDISRYLDQIRTAIYSEFVPLYLGSTKSREFYISHNNVTATVLHRIQNDELVIIADGTYTRLEKSANSDFQYKSFSKQKEDNLIKPFVVSCCDGWIIDIYGAFPANLNDSTIFDYILETDEDLRRILIPNKTTVFLDRGR